MSNTRRDCFVRCLAHLWWDCACLAMLPAFAAEVAPAPYRIQPGDVLVIAVWKEPEMQGEYLVRPDGGVSMVLAGDVMAAGRSVGELQEVIKERLQSFVPNAAVTVTVKAINGNRIYVIGKVNRPGEFLLQRPMDVMQALALAGGPTTFAALDDIRILRRDGEQQSSIPFRYGDVERGRALEQNIVLHGGDTVVVP
jgi:polysaccharide export outer membrane protein